MSTNIENDNKNLYKWSRNLSKLIKMRPDTPRYKQIHPDVSRYVQICPDINRYAQICPERGDIGTISWSLEPWSSEEGVYRRPENCFIPARSHNCTLTTAAVPFGAFLPGTS